MRTGLKARLVAVSRCIPETGCPAVPIRSPRKALLRVVSEPSQAGVSCVDGLAFKILGLAGREGATGTFPPRFTRGIPPRVRLGLGFRQTVGHCKLPRRHLRLDLFSCARLPLQPL